MVLQKHVHSDKPFFNFDKLLFSSALYMLQDT